MALSRNLVLLTRNVSDFGRVPGLITQNWLTVRATNGPGHAADPWPSTDPPNFRTRAMRRRSFLTVMPDGFLAAASAAAQREETPVTGRAGEGWDGSMT
jgi:hypothetical protein